MALRIPYIVTQQDKQERASRMIALSDEKQADFTRRYLGTVRPVLLEHGRGTGKMHGFTDNYIRVNIEPDMSLANQIVNVKLLSLNDDLSVDAEIIHDI
jgi:threonylcarbamoyladenosine tRNA methylthiotransferase MtaB